MEIKNGFVKLILTSKNEKFNCTDNVHCFCVANKNINQKYLFYLLSKTDFSSVVTGAVQKKINKNDIKKTKIYLPNLNEQKQIIDIIEPIEKLETNLKHTDNNLELIGKSLISNINFSELMNENCNFIKGANEKIIENGNTVFLNISAANGKPNKYIKNNPNISIGDITLSLDATTGLVNKALNGFNGYLYKIESKKYQNYEIYYSLLKKENQNIIKMNETGTTIKHSPNSKKQLLVYDFKNKDQLKSFFELSIKIEIYLLSISNLKNKLINLLIK